MKWKLLLFLFALKTPDVMHASFKKPPKEKPEAPQPINSLKDLEQFADTVVAFTIDPKARGTFGWITTGYKLEKDQLHDYVYISKDTQLLPSTMYSDEPISVQAYSMHALVAKNTSDSGEDYLYDGVIEGNNITMRCVTKQEAEIIAHALQKTDGVHFYRCPPREPIYMDLLGALTVVIKGIKKPAKPSYGTETLKPDEGKQNT